ncbi:hypothetical protein ACLOJK_017325, partial [Asimina triloba]
MSDNRKIQAVRGEPRDSLTVIIYENCNISSGLELADEGLGVRALTGAFHFEARKLGETVDFEARKCRQLPKK